MGKYSINDMERLSGIKAHTIRIWEKRYNIFQPERTPTNIRYYTDETLRKVLKITILHNNGYKISRIAELSENQINQQVEEITNSLKTNGFDNQIDALIVSMIDLDEVGFSHILTQLSQQHDFEKIVLEVIYPLFERIGLLWQIGSINPAQEHFISNLIRQKLIVAIDTLPFPKRDKTFLLFLHEKELHELGLLFSSYLLKKNGFKVVYIGQSVPYVDLLSLKEMVRFDYMVTSFISNMDEGSMQEYINRLSEDFYNKQILVSGFQITNNPLNYPSNIIKVLDAKALSVFLHSLD